MSSDATSRATGKLLVSARGIGKKYVIGSTLTPRSLRDRITEVIRSVGGGRRQRSEFWALRDVSFDLHEGEVLGVIGRNGAGKSTLLKILSQITEPTEGEAHLYGRVSSLLEVGVGFHPELSGRENIYLNGAILGMSRAEIRRKFDEIVAFAEVEPFIETPVKRYSSGMYVRLAFAVAAHMEPDILVVDEVLAVGDVGFQRKCLGKLEDMSHSGRAVLVVSHNMSVVSQLCDQVLWLNQGGVVRRGPSREVVSAYLSEGITGSAEWRPDRPASDSFEYHCVSIETADESGGVTFAADQPIAIRFDYTVKKPMRPGRLALEIVSAEGTPVFASASTDALAALYEPWKIGRQIRRCIIPAHLLTPGQFLVTISEPTQAGDLIREHILSFTVTEQNSLIARDRRRGVIAPMLEWSLETPA